ncbi:hypothetical protein FGG08_002878 [Glutinoglossum americanum]|uniref:U1-type domain-containing protein n=1 Tax=Glutinoglossum americanum TaxID=1670608 RepID=A0A9P8HZD8_9PEZI|nr:hypothetical protein FGG08_002878 [Glutinoglossum americanum]
MTYEASRDQKQNQNIQANHQDKACLKAQLEMSEYWKSTPKYWCKHCKTFVRDTKLEKQNHEATPKHQGNLKRFLRDLHRGHERDEREKQRAKDEVERLNNVVSGATAVSSSSRNPPWGNGSTMAPLPPTQRQITPVERKQQIAQLAELGVAIPEEFRGGMAMAGEWQTVSERIIGQHEDEDVKPDIHSIGVRKRKLPGEETDEEDAGPVTKKGWGSTIRTYPEAGKDMHGLDVLLKENVLRKGNNKAELTADGNTEDDQEADTTTTRQKAPIKREESEQEAKISRLLTEESLEEDISVKMEEPSLSGEVVFKKRKVKSIRQK